MYTMSGESSGWACEVPAEARDNTDVSKIHFFDMTTPFECIRRGADYLLVLACVGDFTIRTADRAGVRVNRSRVRARHDRPSGKPGAQIQVVRFHAEGRAQHEAAK
jgi:hypothetical protein